MSVQSGRRVKYRFALQAVRQDWKVVRVLLLEVVDDFYADGESFGRANLTVVSGCVKCVFINLLLNKSVIVVVLVLTLKDAQKVLLKKKPSYLD